MNILKKVIVKIGGSLCSPDLLPPLAAAVRDMARECSLVIIPGGGPFANIVRLWDDKLQLSDDACHWMAVAAMDQYGLLLESKGMAKSSTDINMLFLPGEGAKIFLPYSFLKEKDPLPHSWGVTSDSIAAYLAGLLTADALILLKALDGIPSRAKGEQKFLTTCPARVAVQSGVVDSCFDRYLTKNTNCWIINGKYPERLVLGHSFIGTKVYAEDC